MHACVREHVYMCVFWMDVGDRKLIGWFAYNIIGETHTKLEPEPIGLFPIGYINLPAPIHTHTHRTHAHMQAHTHALMHACAPLRMRKRSRMGRERERERERENGEVRGTRLA